MTMSPQRKEVDLPAGKILYRETGEGPPLVFVHGFLADGRLWDPVIDHLSSQYRCLAPDWPIGSHQIAMKPDADLSLPGLADTVAHFLEAIDLEDVTLVGNDTGGPISQVLASRSPARVGRLILTNCGVQDNFPPKVFLGTPKLVRLPGATTVFAMSLRMRAIRRLTISPLAKREIPADLIDSWAQPAISNEAVRRDLKKASMDFDKRHTLGAAAKLRGSKLPILLIWARGDRFFPIKYAESFASEVGNAHLVEVGNSKTFISLDQPQRLAEEIGRFTRSPDGSVR